MTSTSQSLFDRAQKVIPGGVNSPVRAFRAVGGTPRFIASGEGAYLIDADGKRYVDYIGSWGALIAGHAPPEVIKAVSEVIGHGLTFGAPTELEVEMAETIVKLVPSIDKVRMVNSGTEATMSAIRLARGYTHREGILKFNGCYHGHGDSLLVKAGSGLLTLGIPGCPGIPEDFVKHTFTAEFNDISALEKIFETHGKKLACVILEPVPCNMNLILPKAGFLEALRTLCDTYGTLLIFDEVITGFRLGLSGAQGLFGVTPDLSTFGKIIGGGLPVGAYGGRDEIMDHIAPVGLVYQAGTLSGNPAAMAAGLAMLKILQTPGFYQKLEETCSRFVLGMQELAKKHSVPLQIQSIGSLFGLFFTEQEALQTYADVSRCNLDLFKRFFHLMLEQGIYFAPSAYEAGFISSAHNSTELDRTFEAVDHVFSKIIKEGL